MIKDANQSIALSKEEKTLLETLAAREHMKPGTFARHLCYLGLSIYAREGRWRAEEAEAKIFASLLATVEADAQLRSLYESRLAYLEGLDEVRRGIVSRGGVKKKRGLIEGTKAPPWLRLVTCAALAAAHDQIYALIGAMLSSA